MQSVKTLAIGMGGFVGSKAAAILGSIDPSTISQIAETLVQVIICIATLIGLFKKKK